MLPYGRQTIEQDDIDAVAEALKGDFLTTGPYVERFEEAFCELTGAKYTVSCANGTVALHLACLALDLSATDCVIVPSVTFLATANAARYCGADVVFCDVDPRTGLMTAETFEQALQIAKERNLQPRAVLPVHLTGQPVNLKAIKKIADKEDITVIADACHAVGGEYEGSPIGACEFEDMSTFSFHPVKTIAMGEGGAITTNDETLANRMKLFRHHGMVRDDSVQPWFYEMTELGYNYRLTDIQCALGLSQIKKIDRFIEKREKFVSLYNQRFEKMSPHLKSPPRVQQEKIGWHLYAVQIDFGAIGKTRAQVMAILKEKGVGTQVHYIPIHTQPYYQEIYGVQNLSGAEAYYQQTLSLPLYPSMEEDNIDYVSNAVLEIIGI